MAAREGKEEFAAAGMSMWGSASRRGPKLAPDFKTIADFRKDNGKAIREVCRQFVALCRKLDLLSASVAIDGSKFKAVNARDKNFTEAKMKRRFERIDESIARYLSQLETADSHGDAVPAAKVERLKGKIEKLKEEIVRLNEINERMMHSQDKQISLTDPDARSMATSGKDTGIVGYNVQIAVDTQHHQIVAHEVTNVGTFYRCPAGERLTYRFAGVEDGKTIRRYWTNACKTCVLNDQCTTGPERRISRWEHETVLEKVQSRLDHNPDAMRVRRSTAEHPFGTMKCWMGATHFRTMTLPKVATEMALNVPLEIGADACV